MRLMALILLGSFPLLNLTGQISEFSQINYIPRVGKVHHETVYMSKDSYVKIFKETYLNGFLEFHRYPDSEKFLFVIIDGDTLKFNNTNEIVNGYKTEYFDEFEYIIVSKFNESQLQWSKGIFLGKEINIETGSFYFKLKQGTVLSECRCVTNNGLRNLRWIQFYDSKNIKRMQFFDEETQIEKNYEFYYGNKVAVIQTYFTYYEHIDSIFNHKGNLLYVYQYDSEANLISEENTVANTILHNLMETDYAWDFFYPFNHCGESMLIGSN